MAAAVTLTDETPAPAQPEVTIPGARVTPMGVDPSVSSSIQIINGRRSQWKEVQWVLRWRIEVDQPGTLQIPTLAIVQGSKPR